MLLRQMAGARPGATGTGSAVRHGDPAQSDEAARGLILWTIRTGHSTDPTCVRPVLTRWLGKEGAFDCVAASRALARHVRLYARRPPISPAPLCAPVRRSELSLLQAIASLQAADRVRADRHVEWLFCRDAAIDPLGPLTVLASQFAEADFMLALAS